MIMNKDRKIIVFTGSRGEWGYLRPILAKLKEQSINFNIIVTNMHLESVHGSTKDEILKDGFSISKEIAMNISGIPDLNWSKSLGLLLFQLPDVINEFKPDIALIAGDRAETFIFSVACFYMNLPCAHIQAGELSGHKDGMARHAIGKLVNIHFASNEDAYERLIRFGEPEFRTYLTGAPQIDDIVSIDYTKKRLAEILSNLRLNSDNFIICIFHPSSDDSYVSQYMQIVNEYLNSKSINQIWILPNSDGGGNLLIDKILEFDKRFVRVCGNLNRNDFLHLLNYCKLLIGNSSTGILEAPALGTPSINIGFRQSGRIAAKSVQTIIDFSLDNFIKALNEVPELKKANYSLYGDGKSSMRIVEILLSVDLNDKLLNKYVE